MLPNSNISHISYRRDGGKLVSGVTEYRGLRRFYDFYSVLPNNFQEIFNQWIVVEPNAIGGVFRRRYTGFVFGHRHCSSLEMLPENRVP